MDIEDFNKVAVAAWLRQRLQEDDLCAGRVCGFAVREGRIGRDATFIANPRVELTLGSLDATRCSSEADFLKGEDTALQPLRQAAQAMLADAKTLATPSTSKLGTAIHTAARENFPTVAVIVPPGKYPPMEFLPPPTVAFKSLALPRDGAVLVHPSRASGYVLEVVCDVVRHGPRSTVHLGIAVGRLGTKRPTITRLKII